VILTHVLPTLALLPVAVWPLVRLTHTLGRPAPVVAANMHRLGIELGAGSYRVRLRVDRRPLWLAGLVALIGGLGILGLVAPLRRSSGW
jgi:hypothetical protein